MTLMRRGLPAPRVLVHVRLVLQKQCSGGWKLYFLSIYVCVDLYTTTTTNNNNNNNNIDNDNDYM